MNRRNVELENRFYTISADDEVPVSRRIWAIIGTNLIDEITGEPPKSKVSIGVNNPRLNPNVVRDGIVSIVGIPEDVFPNLANQNYSIQLKVKAEGYIPHHKEVTITRNIDFPHNFAPTEIGSLFLHRNPVTIKGRTVATNGNTTTPISDVSVSITGVWRAFPPANIELPADSPNVVSLQPPLYLSRNAATSFLRRMEMTSVVGEDKYLLEQVDSGISNLRLSNRVNLAPGDIISIDVSSLDLVEYLSIDAVSGASTVDQPSNIKVIPAVSYPHRTNALVRKIIPQIPGVLNPFDQDAIAGDSCVFMASLDDLDSATVVEVSGGGKPVEYHIISRFSVISDGNGYYRLPSISRIAQFEVHADDGGAHQAITRLFCPNYTQRENRLDFIFR
jgi:hypothetical protein